MTTSTIDTSTVLSFRQSLRACTSCPLHETCNSPIPWYGDIHPTFALMGEAPGQHEDQESGRPFTGKSGNFLRHWMRQAGIEPNEVTMLNAVCCRPPNNRTPNALELAACRPWVNGQLEFIRPKVLITCGVVAYEQVTGLKWPKLINVHGKPLFHPRYKFNVWACVDEKTEALTPDGWKKEVELSDGDLIAEVDPWSRDATWTPATFHRYDYSGEMIAYDGRSTSQRLTPNHRCLIEGQGGNWKRVVLAEDLFPSPRMNFPLVCTLRIPEEEGIGEDWAKLLAWFITEGGLPHEDGVSVRIFQSAITGHLEEIRKVLGDCEVEFTERNPRADEQVFTIYGSGARRLRRLAPNRRLLPWVTRLPLNEVEAFLETFIDGDGSRHSRDGHAQIIQKDSYCLDLLQMMVMRLGRRAIVRPRGEIFTMHINSLERTGIMKDSLNREFYQGTVWCPSVPSGFWVARRDGFPFLTGNTYHPAAAVRGSKKYERIIKEDLAGVVAAMSDDFRPLNECYICQGELESYTEWGIGLCGRHGLRQGVLQV